MEEKLDISKLLATPLWQMTGEDFVSLTKFSRADNNSAQSQPIHITGVHALAQYLHCSDSTIFMLRRIGIIEPAIVSQIGKVIVFDGEKARELAYEFQKSQRATRKAVYKL